MGLLRLIANLFGFRSESADRSPSAETHSSPAPEPAQQPVRVRMPVGVREGNPLSRRLSKLRYESSLIPTPADVEVVESASEPYAYARYGPFRGTYLDLSRDYDPEWLAEFGLPTLTTPAELAEWLGVPLAELAWLAGRFENGRPESTAKWHYVPTTVPKRSGGVRLIEAPKPKLKAVQAKILRELLDRIPAHRAAHGFVRKRSAVTNASAHVGAGALYAIDLENFYANIGLSRVVAIFRTVGFSRDVAIWLAHLTTSIAPYSFYPDSRHVLPSIYDRHHLPQGAPTSPALANLSAYGLDVRLAGLAKAYRATYTRYADDLTFSGPRGFTSALRQFIPLAESIIRSERFVVNKAKRRVQRSHQRMTVTGIVVNKHANLARRDYDALKAIVHNCLTRGPASQNHDQHPDFAAHLRGRIEHLRLLNPSRGEKLLQKFDQIRWG